MNSYRWNVLPQAPSESLASASGLAPLIAQILYNRGITGSDQIKLFLAADERLSVDPYSLPDMHQAVSRIYRALLAGERIAVYGDFDTDGITGAVLLVQGLTALGADVIPYIPHRLNEGHGLNHAALEYLRQQGVKFVVLAGSDFCTVDFLKLKFVASQSQDKSMHAFCARVVMEEVKRGLEESSCGNVIQPVR